jgi:propanol-preferring alcohol dehydrogenase
MKAAVLTSPQDVSNRPLRIVEVSKPELKPGHVLLRVLACGICRTDLRIIEGELPTLREKLVPGHQIVGEVVDGATHELPVGMRVGISWIGGTDGKCWYCQRGLENLCDSPTFTGYTVDGGYAEYALARIDFVFPLPTTFDDLHAAPLLCAGIIGFRSLRVAGVEHGDRVGCLGSVRQRIWRLLCLRPGNAKYMSRHEVPPIASWPPPREPFGSGTRKTDRPSHSTAL